MRIFLDTVDIDAILELQDIGIVDGITTNPSLIAKSRGNFQEIIKQIVDVVTGPVSVEVIATNYYGIIEEAKNLMTISDNIVVKIPLTFDGLKACKTLSNAGIKVNVTLCFTANQALLAAKAGAHFISPFLGRLDDIAIDGIEVIKEICSIYHNYHFTTKILVASVRNPNHVLLAAKAGADIVTLPPSMVKQMISHPLTESGLKNFLDDWQHSGKSL